MLDSFAEAAVEAGLPRTGDFNTGDNEGVGYFDVNQRAGWRWNASKAFLRPARSRRNLTIWTGAQVHALETEDDGAGGLRCTGARLRRADGTGTGVRARREVILCAGAIGTPVILQLSGLGPAGLLQSHGIAPRRDIPGVGRNLQDHLQIRTVFKVEGTRTLNQLAASLIGRAGFALEYALRRSGPMSMSPSQLGAFARSDPSRAHPNIQYHVQPLSLDAFGEPLHTFPAITASVCNLQPTSRGSIHAHSPDFRIPPRIDPNYLSTEADRQVLIDSVRLTRRIMAAEALARHAPKEIKPGAHLSEDADIARAAAELATTIFHPVGTARMGEDTGSVVDPRLRVRGVGGLRVVDASVMPRITSGNTNAPTLMIAEKAAEMILADR